MFCLVSKVLVGVDGSECSFRALDFALDLAEKYSASLLILNVLMFPVDGNPSDPLAYSPNMGELFKDLRKGHEAILSRAASRAASTKPNVKAFTELREGNPPDQILDAAVEGNFDVVVVGHGREGRLRELFLGSTSERVAHSAKCPVVIVK
jgi:nucleotide-binding universal stress UspA family protein